MESKPFVNKFPSKSSQCYKCKKTFPSFTEVVMHLKLIHNACAFQDCSKLSDFKLHSSACVNRGLGCAVCNKKFQERSLLLVHFYEHIDAALYACELCKEGFQQKKDLQKHFFQKHNRFLSIPITPTHNKVYQKCHYCSKYFKLFAEFEEHVSSCSIFTYACCICKVGFTSVSALDDHKVSEHKNKRSLKGNEALKSGKRYFCGICYLGFYKGDILKVHVLSHEIEEASYICDVCHVRFPCDKDLQEHYLQHIEEHYVLYDLISQYSCSHCTKTFKSHTELKHHLTFKSCKTGIFLKKCTVNSHKDDELLMSDEENVASESESNIPIELPNSQIYVLKVGETLLNCDDSECVIVMDHTSYCVIQRGVCASESRMPDVKNSEVFPDSEAPETSVIECHMVSIFSPHVKSSANSANMSDNIDASCLKENDKTDDGSIVLNINECDDGSMQCEFVPNSENIQEDFESLVYDNTDNITDLNSDTEGSTQVIVYENQAPFSIEECMEDEDIVNKELLIENGDTLDASGLYICNICKQVFSSETSFSLHMKGSHTSYDCYHCGKSYNSQGELQIHEKIHLNAFQCNVCKVSYPNESLLKNHQQNTHVKANFMCYICKKTFVLKSEYEVHLMFHKDEITSTQCEVCGKTLANVKNYLKHQATHNILERKIKHTCNLCNLVFPDAIAAKNHHVIHEGKSSIRKYICSICDRAFAEIKNVKLHLGAHMKKSPENFECPKCKTDFSISNFTQHIESHIDLFSE